MVVSIDEPHRLMEETIVKRAISGEEFYAEVEARGGYEPWNQHMMLEVPPETCMYIEGRKPK